MPRMTSWHEFISSATPFLTLPRPIEAMQKAGFFLDGEVSAAFSRCKLKKIIDPSALQQLARAYGRPPLPVRLHLGRTQVLPRVVAGFRAAASLDMNTVNAVLAELWNVGTIPRHLSATQTSDITDLPTLSQLCVNVPTVSDAALGNLQIPSAPIASASNIAWTNLHLEVAITLPVLGSEPASLNATLQVEIPLGLQTFPDLNEKLRFTLAIDSTGILGANVTLRVSPSSVIRPASDAATATIETILTTAFRGVLLSLCRVGPLSIPAQVTPSGFPNTKLEVMEAGAATLFVPPERIDTLSRAAAAALVPGAATLINSGSSYGFLGVNISPLEQGNAAGLVSEALAASPYNIHATLDESFGTDVLMAFVNSGDLAAVVNKILTRHLGDAAPSIEATGGSVTFQNGSVSVAIDLVAHDVCLGFKDLNFTISASGPPLIENGFMTVGAQYLDVSVDTGDEIVCLLLSSLVPLGSLLYGALFIYLNNDFLAPAKSIPVSYSFTPLPGSEMDFNITMQSASANDGTLTLDGVAQLTEDTTYTFVCLRVVYVLGSVTVSAIAGAQVTLFELDNPAPAGDDVVIPPSGQTERLVGQYLIEDQIAYQPAPDQNLGTQTTDESGYVQFAVIPNNIGGYETTIETKTNVHTGQIVSTSTTTSDVSEPNPDFGISITDASGKVLAVRRLVALNAVGKHVGRPDNPILVTIDRPIGTGGTDAAKP